MAESAAETVVLRLEQTIDIAADAASGALGRLEAQIVREQGALGRLESSIGLAKAKLVSMSEGAADPRAVAAFEKQGAAVSALEAKLADARDTLAIMAQTRVSAETLSAAQQAAEGLTAKLQEAQAKMAEFGAAAGPQVNVDAFRKQAAAVAAMGDRAAAQRDKLAGLAQKLKNGGAAADGTKVPFAAVAKTLKMLGGETGATEAKGVKLIALFMKMGPTIAAVLAGTLLLVGGIALLGGIIAKGISASSDLRDEFLKLRVAGVTLWNSQRANASGAQQLQDAIGAVATGSALARDKIADYAIQLRNARFTGTQLKTTLEAMAIAGAAGGDALATQFMQSAQAARYFGQDVDKLANRIKTKFGDVAQAKLMSLDVQLLKLKENITWIFSGADIEPFLRGLQSILSLFDQNNAGVRSLRATVTRMTEMAIGGFLRIAIALVKTYIWLKSNKTAWDSIKLVLVGVVVGFAALGAAVLAIVVAVGVLIGAFFAFAAAAGTAIAEAMNYYDAFVAKLHSISLWDVGKFMIQGLVNGLIAAGGAVYGALKSIVMGAVKNVENVLGIRSPSTVLDHRIGFQMGAGIAQGQERSAPVLRASAAQMVSDATPDFQRSDAMTFTSDAAPSLQAPRQAAPPPPTPPGNGAAGGGKSLSFTGCNFGGDLTEEKMRGWLMKLIEGETLDGGAPA